MNTSPPDETAAVDVPDVSGGPLASVVLYVDADNQSPQCAAALLNLFRTEFEARIVSATIAGNNKGQQIDNWREELLSAVSDLEVHALAAPHRKQGADIALLMALGADLERHIREREVVVIVSRDDLVIGAAEQAKARGCKTLIAYADCEIPTARNPHLTTLLLPALAKASPVAPPAPVNAAAAPVTQPARTPAQPPDGSVASVVAQLRTSCAKKPGGGYGASDVGQALSKLGYDKAARERFLESVPGLTVRGTGANKILVF